MGFPPLQHFQQGDKQLRSILGSGHTKFIAAAVFDNTDFSHIAFTNLNSSGERK
jgi:hypothetical protein